MDNNAVKTHLAAVHYHLDALEKMLEGGAGSSHPSLMTYAETAQYLRCTIGSLYQRVFRKQIPYVKIGRSVRFSRDEINKWLSDSHEPV